MSVSAECVGTGGQYNIYANSQLIGEYTVGKVAYTMEKGCTYFIISTLKGSILNRLPVNL